MRQYRIYNTEAEAVTAEAQMNSDLTGDVIDGVSTLKWDGKSGLTNGPHAGKWAVPDPGNAVDYGGTQVDFDPSWTVPAAP